MLHPDDDLIDRCGRGVSGNGTLSGNHFAQLTVSRRNTTSALSHQSVKSTQTEGAKLPSSRRCALSDGRVAARAVKL